MNAIRWSGIRSSYTKPGPTTISGVQHSTSSHGISVVAPEQQLDVFERVSLNCPVSADKAKKKAGSDVERRFIPG
ncbi:hypothetical protein BDM02DRAFT_3119331 [Thelephora ganbajun]|uniref:Uncharacterized protein n=1 Tax=Thelephora ganbajun TaxID=370292 RepID=A0ACB6Z9P9_THEGA|nr:hypothetical protein BDM02DRAFT_3119331 [Thelephora ganbajun]